MAAQLLGGSPRDAACADTRALACVPAELDCEKRVGDEQKPSQLSMRDLLPSSCEFAASGRAIASVGGIAIARLARRE